MEESDKKAIGNRLRSFAEENFQSLADFGRHFGKDRTFFTPYFNGSSVPGGDILKGLAELGCDINWLFQGKRSTGIVREKGVEYVAVDNALKSNKLLFEYPIVADVPAGRSEINHHDWPEYIKIDIDPREHFALKVDKEYGISMAPYIEPGDVLFCSFSRKFNDGDIVVARYDGTKGAVKRIFMNEQITLISFNPLESPIVISKKQLQQVFKVVLIWKKK